MEIVTKSSKPIPSLHGEIGRREGRWRTLTAACILLGIPGVGVYVSLIVRTFANGVPAQSYLQIIWNLFLIVAVGITYRELFRRLLGRVSKERRPYVWLYCGVLNVLWLSKLWPDGSVSSRFLITIVGAGSGIALIASAIALGIEYRALSKTSGTSNQSQ
jgi:hypothetical protein